MVDYSNPKSGTGSRDAGISYGVNRCENGRPLGGD